MLRLERLIRCLFVISGLIVVVVVVVSQPPLPLCRWLVGMKGSKLEKRKRKRKRKRKMRRRRRNKSKLYGRDTRKARGGISRRRDRSRRLRLERMRGRMRMRMRMRAEGSNESMSWRWNLRIESLHHTDMVYPLSVSRVCLLLCPFFVPSLSLSLWWCACHRLNLWKSNSLNPLRTVPCEVWFRAVLFAKKAENRVNKESTRVEWEKRRSE